MTEQIKKKLETIQKEVDELIKQRDKLVVILENHERRLSELRGAYQILIDLLNEHKPPIGETISEVSNATN